MPEDEIPPDEDLHVQSPAPENANPPAFEELQTEINTPAITTSDIQNMEVHHHPHVEKKSFKEYLLEGLMIFLAVTMGFFAENIRENIVNREKEKHYIKNIIADLKSDTTNITLSVH